MLIKKVCFFVIAFVLFLSHLAHSDESKELVISLSRQLNTKKKKILQSLKQYEIKNQKQFSSQGKIKKLYQKLEDKGLESYEIGDLILSIILLECELSTNKKIKSPMLLEMVITGFSKGDQYLARYSLDAIPTFVNTLIDKYIDTIMDSYILRQNIFGEYALLKIPLSEKTKGKYNSFLKEQIKIARTSFVKKEKQPHLLFFKLNMLHYCGKLGDKSATQELIKIYENMKWTDPWDKDSRRALKYILSIGSRDCIIATLETFKENIGAPEYYIGVSPRYLILQELWKKHSTEPFFVKYKKYLQPYTSQWVLDDEIGGETGIKELYSEFSDWIKKNFDYDLKLDGADYKIKAKRVRKYKKY